jgi:hypothetical protein
MMAAMRDRRQSERSCRNALNLDSEELRIIFLTAVCESTPAVIENLFATGDADKWADAWNVRAVWLRDFAGAILRSNPRIIFLSQALRHGVALTAWKRAIERRRSVRAAAEAVHERRKTALMDGATEKRRAETHCRWLALWLFYKLPDARIAAAERIDDKSLVGRRRRAMARALELDLPVRKGRPRKNKLKEAPIEK